MKKSRASSAKLQRAKRKRQHLPPLDPVQRFDIPEASEYLRQSRSKTYDDIKAGKLRVIKDGGRTYVPGSEIARRSAVDEATSS